MKYIDRALLIILLIVGVIIYVLTFVPIRDNSVRPHKQAEFEEKRAQWQTAHLTHYRMTVFVTNAFLFCPPAILEVDNGHVVTIASDTDNPDYGDTDCDSFPEFREQYSSFTIEHAFEFVDQLLFNRSEWSSHDSIYSVDVEYDAQYGFPVEIHVRTSIDHPPYFKITDFEVLSD